MEQIVLSIIVEETSGLDGFLIVSNIQLVNTFCYNYVKTNGKLNIKFIDSVVSALRLFSTEQLASGYSYFNKIPMRVREMCLLVLYDNITTNKPIHFRHGWGKHIGGNIIKYDDEILRLNFMIIAFNIRFDYWDEIMRESNSDMSVKPIYTFLRHKFLDTPLPDIFDIKSLLDWVE